MTDSHIVARAKANYEAEIARVENLFPDRHHANWDELVEMATKLDGVHLCVTRWYNSAKYEIETGEGEWTQEDFARFREARRKP